MIIKTKTILFSLSLLMRISLVVAIILEILAKQWLTLFVTSLALFLTFFPALLKKNYQVTLPIEFEFTIIAFIYAALYLGEMWDFYNKYWWWDTALHGISAMILAIIGFLLVDVLNKDKKANVQLSPFFVALFSFTFALTIGTLWEIFEFLMDTFVGTNMLKTGLDDTFNDLIVDTIGATIISFMGYFYAKKNRVSIVEKLVKLLIKKTNDN